MKSSTLAIKNACGVAREKVRQLHYAYENGNLTRIEYIQELMNERDSIASLYQKASTRTARDYIDQIVHAIEYRVQRVTRKEI